VALIRGRCLKEGDAFLREYGIIYINIYIQYIHPCKKELENLSHIASKDPINLGSNGVYWIHTSFTNVA